ncbi:unnamed protein product [Amoebophrya sp. A25]|nr:unnamed protein product [Amoebophrya sp. A25]|eukprot:GSA25T00022667001.1
MGKKKSSKKTQNCGEVEMAEMSGAMSKQGGNNSKTPNKKTSKISPGGGGKNNGSNSPGGGKNSNKKNNKQDMDKPRLLPNGEVDYFSHLCCEEMIKDIVADSPEINRTLALYCKPDCHKVICDILQDLLIDVGFEECCYWLDVRLYCSIVACAMGVYTIARLRFPADYDALLYMVLAYAAVASFVTWIDLVALGPTSVINFIDVRGGTLNLCVTMEDDNSDVILEVKGAGHPGDTLPGETEPSGVTVTRHDLSRYFDTEGYVVIENLFNDVCGTIERHCGHLPINQHLDEDQSDDEFAEEDKKRK